MATAERCLHSVKAFPPHTLSVSHHPTSSTIIPPPSACRLGVGNRLGGNRGTTDDLNWPKEYSIPCNIMLSNKNWGKWKKKKEAGVGFQGGCGSETVWGSVCLQKEATDFLFVTVCPTTTTFPSPIQLSLSRSTNLFQFSKEILPGSNRKKVSWNDDYFFSAILNQMAP